MMGGGNPIIGGDRGGAAGNNDPAYEVEVPEVHGMIQYPSYAQNLVLLTVVVDVMLPIVRANRGHRQRGSDGRSVLCRNDPRVSESKEGLRANNRAEDPNDSSNR